MHRRILTVVALVGILGTGGVAWSHTQGMHSQALAFSKVNGKVVAFAKDPAMYGGGDMGLDNLYTLENYICTDGIAINVAHQDLGDTGNDAAHQGHALTMLSVQDYGQTGLTFSPPAGTTTMTSAYVTAGASVPIKESTTPDGSYTFASAADNSGGSWQGNTYKMHYGNGTSEPVNEQIVGTIARADHGFIINEDDDNRNISGATVDPNSNGDDSRPNYYAGWGGSDDGSSGAGNLGPPTTANVDGDWATYVDSSGHSIGPTDGSSFDDILRTDQGPGAGFNGNDPNSSPSFTHVPNPTTSRVSDCVIDRAAPQTSADYRSPDKGTWYNSAVSVTLTPHKVYYLGGATTTKYNLDNSGWQTGNAVTVSGEGTHTLQYYSSDSASPTADVETTKSVTINIDSTPPTVQYTSCPTNPVLGSSATASWTASDPSPGSGLATSAGATQLLDTSTVGPHSVTSPAPSDNAGNTGIQATCKYVVKYNFGGFYAPIDPSGGAYTSPNQAAPTFNIAKAGRSIPVKFTLHGNQGLGIFGPGSPSASVTSCSSTDPTAPVETLASGNSTLSYDATSDQYTYVWKTQPAWSNTCRALKVTLNDTLSYYAFFKFK